VTGVEPPLLAKGGGGGAEEDSVVVSDTDPREAEQDTTLDVRVSGSGYDDGSSVRFLLNGKPTKKVKTNSTRFENEQELVANITIALDAVVASYDVEVTTSKRRKGIGTELFAVKEKTKPWEPQYIGHADVTDNADLTQYWVASDGRGAYTDDVDCARVRAMFMLRTVANLDECHAITDWRFLELHLPGNTSFDFDQDGTAEVVEVVPARLVVDDAFQDGVNSSRAGLDIFTVDGDETTSSDFKWFITYANDALVDHVAENTVDLSMPLAIADVASLCEWMIVKKGKGGPGQRKCVDRDPNGLKLPFSVRAWLTPIP
jgi:hypothetical protein